MSDVVTCPLGHRWQPADDAPTACPYCAATYETVELPAPSRLTGTPPPPPGPIVPETDDRVPADDLSALGYEIVGGWARGGTGGVRKAREVALRRLVVLKMIRAGAEATPPEVQRFRREAEAIALLHHPNIIQIYEIRQHRGALFLSLEFADGGSLAHRLRGGA